MQLTGTNQYDEPEYSGVVQIRCRKQLHAQEVILPDKRQVKLEWRYHILRRVKVGDLLDGRRVEVVQEWVDLNGSAIGWRVMT